jgi:limonene-1,2-epoxide hydrolase
MNVFTACARAEAMAATIVASALRAHDAAPASSVAPLGTTGPTSAVGASPRTGALRGRGSAPPVIDRQEEDTMTDADALLKLAERWGEYYNDDCARMVRDCYAPDCQVYPMGLGVPVIEGQDGLQTVEDIVSAAAPRRRLIIERKHASGDAVVVEATLVDPDQGEDWELPFVAVLTTKDGRIITDRTYADWRHWPGL